MITSLYQVNPFDDDLLKKIADYAKKTNNPNLINYYQNIRKSCSKKDYQESRMHDNYYNETFLLIEDNDITGASFIEGYKDEKKYYLSFSTLPDKNASNQILLSLSTSYVIDELSANFIGITIKNKDNQLIKFAINNSYEIIEKNTEHTELVREESHKK